MRGCYCVISRRLRYSRSSLGVYLQAEEQLDLDMRLARLERLMERRPELLSSVLLRQNPHNVHEWLKRADLFDGQPTKVLCPSSPPPGAVRTQRSAPIFYKNVKCGNEMISRSESISSDVGHPLTTDHPHLCDCRQDGGSE